MSCQRFSADRAKLRKGVGGGRRFHQKRRPSLRDARETKSRFIGACTRSPLVDFRDLEGDVPQQRDLLQCSQFIPQSPEAMEDWWFASDNIVGLDFCPAQFVSVKIAARL